MFRVRLAASLVMGAALAWGFAAPRGEAANPDESIGRAEWLIARNPRDARAFYRLGDAYIQKARESGDPAFWSLAEGALGRALELQPAYADAARHLAFALYSRHDFDGAAAQASRAVELNPRDGSAYGILGDAYQETGRYAEAWDAYRRMIDLAPDLFSYSRLAGAKSLRGDTEGAIADLERAIALGRSGVRERESVAWAQWQLAGEHFALGQLPQAEAQHIAALETYPDYHRALAGLGDVRAAQSRYAEAIDLYRRAIAIIPMPGYVAALGDVYARVGNDAEARKQYALVEYIGRLSSLNQVLYNRELAAFYADHGIKLAESLALARRELQLRRDIYAYDVLAWALYKNGRHRDAAMAMQAALALGTKDARLFFHAGMIERALGDDVRAREHLRRALALNPRFQVLQADEAARALLDLEPDSALRNESSGYVP